MPADPTSPPTARRGPADLSSAMLTALLNDTLDPGYRAAARRPPRPRRWWDGPMVWVGCLAVGLLLVVAYQQSHQSAPAREAARQELIDRIHRLQKAGDGSESQARQLAAEVATLRDGQLAANPADSRAVADLEIDSGAVAVTGSGMQVELADPPVPTAAASGRPGTTPQSQVAVIRDVDVRAVVNALWAAGAEAIAVNGLRLTDTSFIRVAGESIQVDFQPISSPYTIEAIGDRNGMQVAFADSAVARQLQTKIAVDGISFRFSGRSGLRLASVTVGQPHYAVRGAATPAPGPTPTPTETR